MARLIDADKLFNYGSVPYYQDDGFRTADRIYGIIKNAPTVDAVEVVHGRWLEFNLMMSCSECDKDWYYADNNCDEFRYCPNCGAQMMDGGTLEHLNRGRGTDNGQAD